jgi:hypothetical protein
MTAKYIIMIPVPNLRNVAVLEEWYLGCATYSRVYAYNSAARKGPLPFYIYSNISSQAVLEAALLVHQSQAAFLWLFVLVQVRCTLWLRDVCPVPTSTKSLHSCPPGHKTRDTFSF